MIDSRRWSLESAIWPARGYDYDDGMRTAAEIFVLVAGLAVLGLAIWTLVGMVRSAARRGERPDADFTGDAGGLAHDATKEEVDPRP